MPNIDEMDVAEAMHLDGPDDLPAGSQFDITAAEELVSNQVEPYADADEGDIVEKCAVFVAAAFIEGTDGDSVVSSVQRDSQSISFDTDAASDEAQSFWHRAQAFDPTGRLGNDTASGSGFFEAM